MSSKMLACVDCGKVRSSRGADYCRSCAAKNSYASPEERFWTKVDKQSEGCWNWMGGRFKKGYGRAVVGNRHVLAHRLAYELSIGPILIGMHVLHHCDNPACVRPDHLFLGTNQDNVTDKMQKGRFKPVYGKDHGLYKHPGKSSWAKLTLEKVLAIKEIYKTGQWTQRAIAKQFDIHPSEISRIVNSKRWQITSG